MYSSREDVEKKIFEAEIELKELKKNYKKIIKSVKGVMSEETRGKAKHVKHCIKVAEKEIRKAKIQFYMHL